MYQGQNISVQEAVDIIFHDQYNKPLNRSSFVRGKLEIEQMYAKEDYPLARITSFSEISSEGVIDIYIAEGIIRRISDQISDQD